MKSKEKKIDGILNFKTIYGVMNQSYPDTFYINCKTWITPLTKSSKNNIKYIKESLQNILKNELTSNKDFKCKFILDFNCCSETLKVGKKNQLKFEIYLEQNNEILSFSDLENKINPFIKNISNNLTEEIERQSFILNSNR